MPNAQPNRPCLPKAHPAGPGVHPFRRSVVRMALALGAILALALSAGCAGARLERVKPWERGSLTDYTMRGDRDPLATAMAEHLFFSREAATGGRGVGGSGCGCN